MAIYDEVETFNYHNANVYAGIMLVFVAVMLLSTIESTFNDMWGVTRGRTWFSRIVQYWTTISLGPIFVVTATALTTGSEVARTQTWLGENSFLGFFWSFFAFF